MQVTQVGKTRKAWESWARWIGLAAQGLLVLVGGAILFLLIRILEAL